MAKIHRVLRCFHCGEILQTTNPKEKGYIPSASLKQMNTDMNAIYCQECFEKMKAINVGNLDNNVDDDVLKILDDAVATDAYIIWVLDIFTFNGNINEDIAKKIKNNVVWVAATRADLFKKKIKESVIEQYIKDRFLEAGITPKTIVLFDAQDEISKDHSLERLQKESKGHDIYMIGAQGSGKTTIINRMLKHYKNKTKWQIKTEIYKGTSAKVLEIPLTNSTFFYELPALSLKTSVMGKVEKDVQKAISPKKAIKVYAKTLTNKDCLLFGNLGYITLISGKPTAFKTYTSDQVEIKKLEYKKHRAFFEENLIKRFNRPVSERLTSFKDFDVFEYTMENDKLVHEISIRGLCWITFIATGQVIRVAVPKGVAIKESTTRIN